MSNDENIKLVLRVSRSREPVEAAAAIIGLMVGVISMHASDRAAADFLRAAADKTEGTRHV